MTLDPYMTCLAFIDQGLSQLDRRDFEKADQLFRLIKRLEGPLPSDQAQSVSTLTLCCTCLLRLREDRADEVQRLREQAMPLVDATFAQVQAEVFNVLLADVLVALDEYWRAIPFYEQVLQSMEKERLEVAQILFRVGYCYSRCGLKEHAAIPLRAALKIYRDYPGDPRLTSVLVTLGNALRKTSPAAAESLYRETAEIHEAKAQLVSATPAWMNLGILCSEQGRFEESLAYFERVLRVREQSPTLPREGIGNTLNNMACCYRRMGNFAEAVRLADRAIEVLGSGTGSPLASAYDTKGEILQDYGSDAEAMEWLQRSFAEREKMPSPDLEGMAGNLEKQIKSLRRLGRLEETAAAEERLASLNTARKNVAQANIDLSSMTEGAEGAVLIELGFGVRSGGRYGIRDAEVLGEQLAAIVRSQNAGFYGGRAAIPESTTLMLYGPNGEELFRVVERFLLDHSMCDGAVVTIRQGSNLRQVMLPCALN